MYYYSVNNIISVDKLRKIKLFPLKVYILSVDTGEFLQLVNEAH